MATQIKIEKNVPLPAPRTPRGRWPFREMAINDSFVVKLADTEFRDLRHLGNTAASNGRRAFGPGAVVTRTLPDGSGIRVWRIA